MEPKKNASAPSPLGNHTVPWLKLTATKGSGLEEVYRVHTVDGSAPATCHRSRPYFQVDYAAEYWFYGH
ncbi:hypothetical protein BDV25DRAFT_160024 [Aspergillus avenaceus]|uniref:Uncharacterized protein n=1 Tax=Aspergillus avenaceus TaxID=36643 RepID=A0A5N6TMT2_ASPAV|nr:hypothetical protein BDV25DRAFT_160024 [Aspergillus avenaceus]